MTDFTVTDANGCTATAEQSVIVEDVTCSNNGNQEKVIMCHDGETVCVNINSVSSHLNHGDYLGPCTAGLTSTQQDSELGRELIQKSMANRADEASVEIYPNPFRNILTVNLALEVGIDNVSVTLYDIQGMEIDQLWSGPLSKGTHTMNWDGNNHSAGVYILVIQTDSRRLTRQVLLMK